MGSELNMDLRCCSRGVPQIDLKVNELNKENTPQQ